MVPNAARSTAVQATCWHPNRFHPVAKDWDQCMAHHAHHGRTIPGLVAHDTIKVEAVRAGWIEVALAFPGRFLALRIAGFNRHGMALCLLAIVFYLPKIL